MIWRLATTSSRAYQNKKKKKGLVENMEVDLRKGIGY